MRYRYSYRKMAKLFANSKDPDQTPQNAASDLGLHYLPFIFLGVSQLQWVNTTDRHDGRCYIAKYRNVESSTF